MSYMIGVDVGGTFTDFSVFDQETGELFNYKDSSTPADPSKAIVKGVRDVLEIKKADPETVSYLAHGTTVGTNALIEKKGCRLGLITTKGFKDLMEIGTQRRPSLYNLQAQKPYPLVPSGLNCTVAERIRYDGSIETPLDEEETREVVRYLKAQGVAAIAVCTLFSFINPVHEERIEEIIHEEFPEAYVTISSKLAPEFREFSRMSTTVMNSYLGPVMKKYVNNFRESIAQLGIKVEPYVTQSNGSIISIKETIDCPIKTALSGPSAGVIAAAYIGKQCEADKIITFDMGGTSADISLIENYTPQVSNERYVEGYPARIPMINIIGDEGMGYYGTAFNVYNIALLLSSYSLPLAISKLITARRVKGRTQDVNRVFRSGLTFGLIAGGLMTLFLLLEAWMQFQFTCCRFDLH